MANLSLSDKIHLFIERLSMDGVFIGMLDTTKTARILISRTSGVLILFLYVLFLTQRAYFGVILAITFSVALIYFLNSWKIISWSIEEYAPVFWCWSPLGLFFVHSDYVFFPLQHSVMASDNMIVQAKLFAIHVINLFHFSLPLIYNKPCNLCYYPYYLVGIFWFIMPEFTLSWGPLVCAVIIFTDTVHHYGSHHVKEYELNNITKLLIPLTLVFFILSGTYSLVAEGCGFLISLIFNLPPLRTLCELLIEPESIIGVQLGFLAGQVGFTSIIKIFYMDSNIWGSVLRGLITGRILLIYTIQDEIKKKKALGTARLI